MLIRKMPWELCGPCLESARACNLLIQQRRAAELRGVENWRMAERNTGGNTQIIEEVEPEVSEQQHSMANKMNGLKRTG